MKRFLILISCILLIVSLSVSAFAASAPYFWGDYIASTTPGIDYDINDVFIPASLIVSNGNFRLRYYYSGAIKSDVKDSPTISFTNTFTSSSFVSILGLVLTDREFLLDIRDIDYQSSLDLIFSFSGISGDSLKYRYRFAYYDSSNTLISYSSYFSSTVSLFNGSVAVPLDFGSIPDGTAFVSFDVQLDVGSFPSGDYTVSFVGFAFDVLTEGTLSPSPDPDPDPDPDPAIPGVISLSDFIVNESSDGNTSTLRVSVPSRDLVVLWHLLRSDDFATITNEYGADFSVSFDRYDYDYWVDCQVLDKFDISDIVDGSTLSVDFDISSTVHTSQPLVGGVRYQIRYYDINGNLLDSVKFFDIPDADWFDEAKLDILVNKPSGAVYMSFIAQFMDIWSEQLPCSFTLDLESVDFVCDIPTMVRVQEETGKTNKLLQEIKDGWTPDPDVPPFKDDVDQVIDKENEIVDSLNPDQTIGDLEDIQLTIFDNLLLYAGGFLAIQRIFDIFIDIPWLKMVIYVSLALGLLGAFLNIGAMASRADRASKSRKGD